MGNTTKSSSTKSSSNKSSSTKTTTTTSTKKGSVMPTTSTKTVTPTTKTTTTSTKNSSTPYAVGTAANGWTMMSNWTVVWGKSTPTTNSNAKAWAWSTVWTNINSTKVTTTPTTTTKTTTTSNAGYVSSKNNWNGTTTYTKANWDSWTENSKWQVISKVVGWGWMSVNPNTPSSSSSNKTSTTSWTKTWTTTSSVKAWTNPIVWSTNTLANFINNTGTYKTQNSKWSAAVATNPDGTIRYADGSTYNPKTGLETKATSSSAVATKTTSSTSKTSPTVSSTSKTWNAATNGYMSYDYTRNNAKWSPAVMSGTDWTIRYADGSSYNPQTGKTTWATKTQSSVNANKTQVINTNAGNTVKNNFDYKKENANWSPAIMSMADGSVKYADGSVYNPKTGQTVDNKWNVVKDNTQSIQVTEWAAREAANTRANNSSANNSTSYNPISSNNNVNNNAKNQSALTTVLKNQTDSNIAPTVKTDALDTWTTRDKGESKESASYDKETGILTYIAPNGKTYNLYKWEDGNLAFISQWWDNKWSEVNYTEDWVIINDPKKVLEYIKANNAVDGIDRSNVDNKDAVRNAEIIWTYNAPSGKEYDILEWTWPNAGKVGFVNYKWEAQWFDTQDAALDYIDARNPKDSLDTGKNQIREDRKSDVSDSITDMNEKLEEREEADEIDLDALKQEWYDEWESNRDESDDIYYQKQQLVNQMFNDIDTFDRDINDAIDDLKQKSELLQDNERMRWARQRAAELAAQWYLTSEQVAQVANYSLSDYNKELEANALEAAKAIAELRINIAQKKQDYLNAIRTQQFANENDRQTQLNYASERFDKMLQYLQNKESEVSQFYGSLYNSNLAMNAQNELWYESIIKQNDAQNIVNDRNLQLALTDTSHRRQYILNQISDVNLHAYAEKIMNYLQSQWKFLIRNWSTEQMKSDLASQISWIVAAAKQAQLEDQKSLAKS